MLPSKGTSGPRRSREEYMQLASELIAEGQAIQRDIETRVVDGDVTGDAALLGISMLHEEKIVDRSRFVSWQSSWATLLTELVPPTHPQRQRFEDLCNSYADPSALEEMLALLVGMRQGIEKGLLEVPTASFSGPAVLTTVFDSLMDGELKERCSDILTAPGKFDRVVNQATLVLEDRIRKCSGLSKSWTGVGLVNKALNADLAKTILLTSADKDEHEGICHICRGIMQAFRNPTHHYITDKYTREDAIKLCAFVDNLLRAIDDAKVQNMPQSG